MLPRLQSKIAFATSLMLAAACLFFSLSDALMAWFHADELTASMAAKVNGLLGCVKLYYMSTTINRIGAVLSVCAMGGTVKLISSPYWAWITARFVFYALVPVSIALFCKKTLNLSFKQGLTPALFSASAAFALMNDGLSFQFGLALAIYALATFTFFILIALLSESIESRRAFTWFCLAFAFNLNSHEIFLLVSGGLIAVYAWYRQESTRRPDAKYGWAVRLKTAARDRNVQILFAIFIVSVLLTLVAPGVETRQKLWPSSSSNLVSLLYLALTLEDLFAFICRSYPLLVLVFLAGALFPLAPGGNLLSRKKLLAAYLLFAPLAYLLITGFLIGKAPSLWMPSDGSRDGFQFLESAFPALFQTDRVFSYGRFAIRQYLFLYTALFLDVFLAGFLIAGPVFNRFRRIPRLRQTVLASIGLFIFLFHPDGGGSTRILAAVFTRDSGLNVPASTERGKSGPSPLILALFPNAKFLGDITKWAFNRIYHTSPNVLGHDAAIQNVRADAYLVANRGKAVPYNALDPVYSIMYNHWYRVTGEPVWRNTIYSLYQVQPSEPPVQTKKEHEAE